MAIDTYEKQNSFLRRMIKSGNAKAINTWYDYKTGDSGEGWIGECDGFKFRFETTGRKLVAGSFYVYC